MPTYIPDEDEDIDIDELDAEKFEALDENAQDEVKAGLAERLFDDPDEVLAKAEELGISGEEIFDEL